MSSDFAQRIIALYVQLAQVSGFGKLFKLYRFNWSALNILWILTKTVTKLCWILTTWKDGRKNGEIKFV